MSFDKLFEDSNLLISKIVVEFTSDKDFVKLQIFVRGVWSGVLVVDKSDWVLIVARLKWFGSQIEFVGIPLAGVPTLPKN